MMPTFGNIWEITPQTAHPRARQLLADSIVWNYGDEDSPLGTDLGADTFAAYLNFRTTEPIGLVRHFLGEQLASRAIPDTDWEVADVHRLGSLLSSHRATELLRRDELIIALAFAQLLLEGSVDTLVRQRAIAALDRQATDLVLSFRGGGGKEMRKKQLACFKRVLESA